MVSHSHNALGAHFAIDSANRQEWCGEIVGVGGVNTVNFHLTGAVDVFSVAQIDCHMCHAARLGAKEQQVAGLRLLPFVGLDDFAGECLLRSVALQDNGIGEIAHFRQAGAVGKLG